LELVRTPPDARLSDVFARACELAAEAVGVERVGVWLFVDTRSALRCVALFERSSREHSNGAVIRVADFPTYFASLNVRKAVPAEVAAQDPRTAELAAAYLNPLGITSMLDAGIFRGGELAGVVCFEHVGRPREWTTEVRDFAGSVADLLALRMEAADLEELKAAYRSQEGRLTAIERAESLEQMAAGVAHDFRNLLTVVAGNVELVEQRPDLAPEARDQLQAALAAARRGADLTTELLEFARPNHRPPVVLNLAEATAEFVPVLQAAVGNRYPIRYASAGRVGQVLVDKGQYTRVLLNLAVNARDAMPQGGEIRVQVAPVKLTDPAGPVGNFVMLTVSDRGAGMDEATRKKAFEPFFSTKSKGTGVGLTVVRRAVDRAGGIVRIESRPGQGTRVRAFFPRVGASGGETSEFPALPPE
jgi:signal transduction histidine kinase